MLAAVRKARTLGCIVLPLLSASLTAAAAEKIRLQILDEEGLPAAARVRLRDKQGVLHPVQAAGTNAPLLAHPRFPDLGIIVKGEAAIDVPAPDLAIEVDRGTEYLPHIITSAKNSPVQVRFKRWIDMPGRGWWSADLHVHRNPADVPLLIEAAGLNFAPVITKWNQNSNLEVWPEQPLARVTESQFYSVDNAEDERPWGAALFLGLKTPIPLYNAKLHWPPPTATWEEARKRNAFIDQEKIIWWAAPVIAALIRPDTIGVANNHFLEEGMLDSEAWGRPRDREKYPGLRGFANYIFDLYYTYLSAGLRIPASAGSANGVLKNPLGYSRSYVFLGKSFTPEAWLAAQKAGRNFVTNGPMLFLTVNGELPGAVLPSAAKTAQIDLAAISGNRIERVELIVNGRIVHSFQPEKNTSQVKTARSISVSSGDWIAARCFEANPGTVRFAHTSPVYVGGVPLRDPEALARLRDWIDKYIEQIRALPPDALNAEQQEHWVSLCRKARESYR
jgi:hypothetical protein